MIFAPFGVENDEVVDPETLAREFQEAMRIAQQTTQFQWHDNAIQDITKLEQGAPVAVRSAQQIAHLYRDPYNSGTYDLAGHDPDLTVLTGDSDLYHIPYNRGWSTVTGTEVTWTSPYPELCFFICSFQFVRNYVSSFGSVTLTPRVQMRIAVDSGIIPGSGPYGTRISAEPRMTGLSRRSISSCICAVTLLPAGSHNASLLASQTEADVVAEAEDSGGLTAYNISQTQYLEDPPTEGVCIGNRRLTVVSFPRGGQLGG